MGAFCVFGVSRQVCRRQAERKVMTFELVGVDNTMRHLTAVEWGGARRGRSRATVRRHEQGGADFAGIRRTAVLPRLDRREPG